MELDLSNISTIIGILGAYFAVIFVLAVSVETLLEPFTSLPWLRKKLDPDEILKDIKEWLPTGSDAEAKVTAIQSLTTDAKMTEEELLRGVQDLKQVADEAIQVLGPDSKITKAQKELALKFAALRRKYALEEKQRITLLRVIAGLIGVIIAIMLRLDTFDVLGVLFPPDVQQILTQPNAQLGGMLITGLAASAGSSFWHDMLGRARNLKDTVQGVSQVQMVQKA
jgi:hypothetical protein